MNTDKIFAEQLANEYAPKDTSKVVALRKLDAKAKLPATVFTYTLGIVSSLVLGTGMCLTMGQIGGGTTISAGTLQIGAGGTAGSITGDVVDNGTLTFARKLIKDAEAV